jgi:hypothetical protein
MNLFFAITRSKIVRISLSIAFFFITFTMLDDDPMLNADGEVASQEILAEFRSVCLFDGRSERKTCCKCRDRKISRFAPTTPSLALLLPFSIRKNQMLCETCWIPLYTKVRNEYMPNEPPKVPPMDSPTRRFGTKTKMRSTLYYRQYIQFNSRAPAVLAHTFCCRQLADFSPVG